MKTVLVVEDDAPLALALSLRLKRKGYRVLTAHDALAGVSAAVRESPDLMVIDLMMPAGGGFSLVERVQRQVPKAIPIIVTTGSKEDHVLRRALDMGVVAFFAKPYDGEQVAGMVQAVLGRADGEARPAR